MSADKSIPPTKKKIEKARKEGKVLKSQLLTQTIAISATLTSFVILAEISWVRTNSLVEYTLKTEIQELQVLVILLIREFLFIVCGALGCGVLASILADGFQVGFSFQPSILKPRSSRLSIVSGGKRILEGFKGAWQPLLRCVILCVALVMFFYVVLVRVINSAFGFYYNILKVLANNIWLLFVICTLVYLVLCAIEYLVNYRKYYRELSMSHQEYRREVKDDEGDPLIKSYRKSIQEEIMHQDFVARVKKSKVIVFKKSVK